jgi:hypothetical protein
VNKFKSNFFTSYCPLCSKSNHKYEDTQAHALICEALKKEMTISQIQVLNTVTYNDIFSSVEAQFNVTKVTNERPGIWSCDLWADERPVNKFQWEGTHTYRPTSRLYD